MSQLLVVGPGGFDIWTILELEVALKVFIVHVVLLPFLTTLAY